MPKLTSIASITRPADTNTYASGDLIANSVTTASVVAMTFPAIARAQQQMVQLRRVRINKTGTATSNASARLHLYKVLPTSAVGDNGVISSNQGAAYLGQVDVTIGQAFSDGAAGQATTEMNFHSDTSNAVYGLLEARGAYVPASAEVFTVTLELDV